MRSWRILVTRRCNQSCSFCTIVKNDAADQPLTHIQDALRGAFAAGAQEIVFTGGEPLLRTDFPDIIAAARAGGAKRVVVETNGTLLSTPEAASSLVSNGVSAVRISLAAVTHDEHRCQIAVETGPQQVLDGIGSSLKAGLDVSIRLPISSGLSPAASRLTFLHDHFPSIRRYELAPLGRAHGSAARELAEAFDAGAARGLQVLFARDAPASPCLFRVTGAAFRLFSPMLSSTEREANTACGACASCALAKRCRVTADELRATGDPAQIAPLSDTDVPRDLFRSMTQRGRTRFRPVPPTIVEQRGAGKITCVTPWTTMKVVDTSGLVYQCSASWTKGNRGSIEKTSLAETWNGPGYQDARRAMASPNPSSLCESLCPRLYDQALSEARLQIQEGSEPFVRNQLLLAEEIAQRRDVLRAKPLHMVLSPSTYCNYDCVMCNHGRTPRRDLPESLFDELPAFLPTLQTLTFGGGEPLANRRTWEFLTQVDIGRYPDLGIVITTNGSLLTGQALKKLERCPLASLTISVNAGRAEEYERVQRPSISFEKLLENVDHIVAFRDSRPWGFDVQLSFVVQPEAAHTLIPFGELARSRNTSIRLMPVNPVAIPEMDFYRDPDEVARVLEHLDAFIAWASRVRPEWVANARGAREGIVHEATVRQAGRGISLVQINTDLAG